jgi:dTDP-4-amino-4,6-dideoxygalactose transaminase
MRKLIPRLKPYFSFCEIISALSFFKKGSIEKFEKKFSSLFENKYGVFFSYGRSGLYSIFKALNIKGKEVILPAYTCIVVPHAVVKSGNVPVFIDCAKNSFNMDISQIEKNITKNTAAIIITHIFGYPADIFEIKKIVERAEKKYETKIIIIEDMAHSFGAKYKGKLVSSIGDFSIFGLNISKYISTVFGGMVITNDEKYYKILKKFRNDKFKKNGFLRQFKKFLYFLSTYITFNPYFYGFVNFLENSGFLDKFVKYYDEGKIEMPPDFNYLPGEMEARIGLCQIKKYEKIKKERIKNAFSIMKKYGNFENITFFKHIPGATYSHLTALTNNREKILKKFRKKGIQLGIIIEYSIPYMKDYQKYKKGEYPVSLDYSKRTINFPNYPGIEKYWKK